ncbi:peptidase S1 and S6 chymotrypsin/Hap [Tolumonas auensis DSM 9187]|uniref:Peptidase S1 and S6 chymotrypsin/Hap n=1 Tax=Tolumonas auensis (strain DSM 9187 / NBRC 110442 / TA 4) TaxID=595494 RepID=C4L7L5_TOLAT|nr:serine protease [Tolumonas auensis]ACQ93631.1 peptidase S1 and S6 chymotrypsin/Hap [Tolumonas auensis DSM 9187]
MLRSLLIFALLWLNIVSSSYAETISPKVVGGTTVPVAPSWMAALWIDTGSGIDFCSGTLIDTQWIMTAAHCVEMGNAPVITAQIGQADITEPANLAVVDKIVISPNYNSSTMYGDIALLHITTPQYVPTVTLPYRNASSSELYEGIQMRVYGWGETEAGVTEDYASATPYLQTATLTFQGFDYDFPDHIFAGDYGKDTCFGDSGSPLLFEGIQYGITSFGFTYTCGTGIPGGYTDVSHYSNWISDTIAWIDGTDDHHHSSGGGSGTELALMGFALLLLRLGFRFRL